MLPAWCLYIPLVGVCRVPLIGRQTNKTPDASQSLCGVVKESDYKVLTELLFLREESRRFWHQRSSQTGSCSQTQRWRRWLWWQIIHSQLWLQRHPTKHSRESTLRRAANNKRALWLIWWPLLPCPTSYVGRILQWWILPTAVFKQRVLWANHQKGKHFHRIPKESSIDRIELPLFCYESCHLVGQTVCASIRVHQ